MEKVSADIDGAEKERSNLPRPLLWNSLTRMVRGRALPLLAS